jgi:hypothetical protein
MVLFVTITLSYFWLIVNAPLVMIVFLYAVSFSLRFLGAVERSTMSGLSNVSTSFLVFLMFTFLNLSCVGSSPFSTINSLKSFCISSSFRTLG